MDNSNQQLLIQLLATKRDIATDPEADPDLVITGYVQHGKYLVIKGHDFLGVQIEKEGSIHSIGFYDPNALHLSSLGTCLSYRLGNDKMFIDELVVSDKNMDNLSCIIDQLKCRAINLKIRSTHFKLEQEYFNHEIEHVFRIHKFHTEPINNNVVGTLTMDETLKPSKNFFLLRHIEFEGEKLKLEISRSGKYTLDLFVKKKRSILVSIKIFYRWKIGEIKKVSIKPGYEHQDIIFPVTVFAVIAAINTNCSVVEFQWTHQTYGALKPVINALRSMGAKIYFRDKKIRLNLSLTQVEHLFQTG